MSPVIRNPHHCRQMFFLPLCVFTTKRICFGSLELSRKAPCSIRWVSATVLSSQGQHFVRIICSLKSVISVENKIARYRNVTSKIELNKTKRRRMCCPALGTLIRDTYCSRHLAAEMQKSSSREQFKFPELGITSCNYKLLQTQLHFGRR